MHESGPVVYGFRKVCHVHELRYVPCVLLAEQEQCRRVTSRLRRSADKNASSYSLFIASIAHAVVYTIDEIRLGWFAVNDVLSRPKEENGCGGLNTCNFHSHVAWHLRNEFAQIKDRKSVV